MWQFFCWESFVYLFIYSNIRTKRPLKMCIRTTVQVIKSVSYSCVPWQAEVWCAIFRGWHQYTDNAGRWVRYSRERKGSVFIYRHLHTMYISKRSGMDHTVLPANTPCLPFLCKRSPDGAIPNWDRRHPIAAYYSSIDPEGMKGWVGLVGWPTADGLPT